MTPAERLKEIDEDLSVMPNDALLDGIRFENYCWLINRVKRLTEALEKFEIGHCTNAVNCVGENKARAIARKALEEE